MTLPAHDERHTETLLENVTLIIPAVLAGVEALVTHIDDERLLGQTLLIQIGEDVVDRLIHAHDGAEVVLHVPAPALHGHIMLILNLAALEGLHELAGAGIEEILVDAAHAGVNAVEIPTVVRLGSILRLKGIPVEIRRNLILEATVVDHLAQLPLGNNLLHHLEGDEVLVEVRIVPVAEIPTDSLTTLAEELRDVRPSVIDGRGRRHLRDLLLHLLQVAGGRDPVTVGSLVTEDERERLALIAILDPVDSLGGKQIRHITALRLTDGTTLGPAGEEMRVPVLTLANEHLPGIETGGLGDQVPLTDDTRVVTGGLQHLGVGRLRAVEGRAAVVIQEGVVVRVTPREHAGAGGPAEGVCTIGAIKHHTFLRHSAEAGQGHGAVLLAGAQSLDGMVIRYNEQDVRPLIGSFHHGDDAAERAGRHRDNGGQFHTPCIVAHSCPPCKQKEKKASGECRGSHLSTPSTRAAGPRCSAHSAAAYRW